jgi:hypothetical protein
MRTILFDYPGSSLNHHYYAVGMRMGYLFANKVVYGGEAAEVYHILQHGHALSPMQKVEALKFDPDSADIVEETKTTIKATGSIRHKPSHLLASTKKFDASMHTYFEHVLRDIGERFYGNGFLPAAHVFGMPEVFQRLFINKNPERGEKTIHPFSDWLLLNMEEEEGDIVMLTEEFLQHHGLAELNLECSAGQTIEQGEVYLHHCITLPDPSLMDMHELKHTRNYASTALAAFKQVMNQWIDLFVENEEGVSTCSFFNEHVFPAATQLDTVWKECALLEHVRRRVLRQHQMNAWIGEVPVQMIWQFYKDTGVIPPLTWNRLQQATAADDRLKGTWPVIVLRASAVVDDDIPVVEDTHELPLRKTIRL